MVKLRQPTPTGILVNRMIIMESALKNVSHHLLDMEECGMIFHARAPGRLFVKEISSLESIATV